MEEKKKKELIYIIKNIIGENGNILYKDYGDYFIISTLRENYWICRLTSNNNIDTISFPVNRYEGEANAKINKMDDIFNYTKYVIDAFNNAITF